MGHLSQLHHDVFLMMGEEEKVRYCLLEAVEVLDQKRVLKLFRCYISFGKCLHHLGYIFEDAWTSQLWEDEQ